MSAQVCEKCGARVIRERRAEGSATVWLVLDAEPLSPAKFTRYGPKKDTRVIDGRKAYLPADLAAKLGAGESIDEYPWHSEHKCGGR